MALALTNVCLVAKNGLGQHWRNDPIHVAVTGRDRRHLPELRNKFRVVVVGAQDTRRGVVVDAYVPAERIDWLREKGYGVQFLEEVETPGRTRQAEGRAAAEARLKRGRYGDVIWGEGTSP